MSRYGWLPEFDEALYKQLVNEQYNKWRFELDTSLEELPEN